MSITKTWSRDMGRLGIDPDQAGLVAGYDMVPRSDGTIEDKSGNGNSGNINGPAFEFTEIGPSMKFDGVDDYIDCGAGFQALTDVTVSLWFSINSDITLSNWVFNYYLSTLARWGVRLASNATPGLSNLDIFDDIDDVNIGRYQTTVQTGLCYHLTAQINSLENKLYLNNELIGSGESSSDDWSSFAGLLYLGAGFSGGNFSPINMSNVKVFNRALTPAEIQAEYQAGAQAINWKSDYGVSESVAAEATPGELSNSPARIISGTHKIATDTINGCSAKAVECVTAGVVAIPTAYFFGNDTQAAHGGFEWWMKKGAGGNTPAVGFVAKTTAPFGDPFDDGYYAQLFTVDRFRLLNSTGAVLQITATNSFITTDWNKIKMTISADGIITTYINDVLLDLTGGAGSNPVTDITHTTSKYLVLDLDAGDKVAWAAKNGDCAITKYQGVV